MSFLNSLSTLVITLPAAYALVVTDPSLFSSKSYDYVVVGAGTAGLTVAARLAEDTSVTVGVIEAGQYFPNDPLIDVPKNVGLDNGQPKYDWIYTTTPQAGLGNRTMALPRGKVVGGSSALNYLVFNRASKTEYDAWEEFGNQGWKWDCLLEGFKASTNYTPATDAQMFPGAGSAADANSKEKVSFFGTTGEIDVTYDTFYSDLSDPYVQSLASLGVSINASPDSGSQMGVYNCPRSVDPVTGKRSYAGSTYYADHVAQDNFSVLTGAQATKINFGDSKENGNIVAQSVAFVVNGNTYTVSAKREIILSAGVFQSPQLLELSGVGNAAMLKSLGISPLIDLPGVGENLQDHLFLAQMFQLQPGLVTWDQLRINQTFAAAAAAQYNTTHDGPLTSTGISALAFLPLQQIMSSDIQLSSMQDNLDKWLSSTNPTPLHSKQYDVQKKWISDASVPMIELLMVPMAGLTQTPPANDTSYVTISAAILLPFARGSVHINTTDPLAHPVINPNYLNNPFDTQVLVRGMEYVNKISTSPPFSQVITRRIDPPTNFTDADSESYVRASARSVMHPMGTCAMAKRDLQGVVDPSLKVYGTTNLRVVDASIIPMQIAAHLQSTTYAIGEKAATIIKTGSTLPSSGRSSNASC